MGVGASNVTLLFADTKVEDPDLYRFLASAARSLYADLVIVADGRTPFEVFHDRRFLGNSRQANCSTELKQKPCREWLDENANEDTIVYVGIDWSEEHRMPGIVKGWAPYEVRAPLCHRPFLSKDDVTAWAKTERLRPPRAYAEGFPHNNCLQQGCVRGGQAYWALLLRTRPDAYAYAESEEEKLRVHLGANVAILKDRTGGTTTPWTLRGFRESIQHQGSMFDTDEWGGCGCFTDEPATAGIPA